MDNRGVLSKMFQDIVSIGSPKYSQHDSFVGGAPPQQTTQPPPQVPPQAPPQQTTQAPPQQTTQAPSQQTTQQNQVKQGSKDPQGDLKPTNTKNTTESKDLPKGLFNKNNSDKPSIFSNFLSNNSNSKVITVKSMSLPYAGLLYKRIFVISVVFCLAIYLASITFRSKTLLNKTLKLYKEKTNSDPYFDKEDETNNNRWRRIMQMIVLLSVLAIAYFIAIIIAIFCIILLYLSMVEDGDVLGKSQAVMKNIFWEFELNGAPHILLYFYAIVIFIIFSAMMVFMIYHLIIKGYLGNLTYPVYTDMKKKNAPQDFTAPTKFAMHYGMYLIIIFMFFLVLFSFFHLSQSQLIRLCLIFIITALMFMMLIYKYSLERSGWRISVLWIVFILWTATVYFMMPIQS